MGLVKVETLANLTVVDDAAANSGHVVGPGEVVEVDADSVQRLIDLGVVKKHK